MVKLLLALSLVFSFASQATTKKVLVVLSEKQSLKLKEGKSYQTGNYLNEFAIPLMTLIDAGFEPVYFTPTGKAPALDKDSISTTRELFCLTTSNPTKSTSYYVEQR